MVCVKKHLALGLIVRNDPHMNPEPTREEAASSCARILAIPVVVSVLLLLFGCVADKPEH